MSIHNLSESYNAIYEGKSENIRSKMVAKYGEPESRDTLRQHATRTKYMDAAKSGKQPDFKKNEKQTIGQAMYKSHQSARSMRGESVDYCDLILSYLVDEGYANTLDAAVSIMNNMSEDWMSDILISERVSPADVKLARSGVLSRGADELEKLIKNVRLKKSEPSKLPTRKKRKLSFEVK